jgi:hypothetical protein
MQGVSGVNNISGKPLFHPEKDSVRKGFAVRAVPPPESNGMYGRFSRKDLVGK